MPADPRTVLSHSLLHKPPIVNPTDWSPAPEPAPPPPPLTAKEHRARLAEVVDAFQAATDRLTKLNTAHQRAQRDSTDAFLAVVISSCS
jgi:hypothetical protein